MSQPAERTPENIFSQNYSLWNGPIGEFEYPENMSALL